MIAEQIPIARSIRPVPYWYALWLAVALVASKAVLRGWPNDWSLDAIIGCCHDVAVMAHADVLFALGIGVAGSVSIARTARRPMTERAVRVGFAVACVVSVIYAIVSVQVFAYLRTPLTYPLIYLAGDMKNMRSSLGAFLTPAMLATLAVGPIVYVFLASASQYFIRPRTTRWVRAGHVTGLVVVLVYVAWGHQAYSSLPWCDRVDRRVAENPHWVLVKSLLTDLTSDGERIQLGEEFPPEHLVEFAVASERRAAEIVNSKSEISDLRSQITDSNSQFADLQLARPTRPANVIVYVLESVGAQYLGLYGSPYATTPRLEAEQANSLVFDNFYAHCGVTANSLVAINLGIYPGLTWREYTVEQPNLPGTTIAELLKERDYRTAYMISGEIEYVNMDGFLAGRGYDAVWGYSHLPCKELIISWGVEDRCLVDGALSWIDRDPAEPFFLMVWTQQTHHPYEPSPRVPFIDFFKGSVKDKLPPDDYDLGRYLNVVHEADRQIGRLFDGLRTRGLADDTLVVVTGDHGEGFGSPHDIYGHGGRVFDEIVKVPLVLWNPRLFGAAARGAGDPPAFWKSKAESLDPRNEGGPSAARGRIGTIGGHIDLNPTLAEMLDLPAPDSWQGRSLFDPDRPPRAYFYAANDDYLLGVREHDWKYTYNATIGRDQLFDLSGDPSEQNNVAIDYPDRCHDLRQRLAAWMKYEEGHMARLRDSTPPRRVVAAGVAHGAEP